MTLLQKALNHYIAICSRSTNEKLGGWQCAKDLAEKYPDLLGELPALITETMRQKSKEPQIESSTHEIRTPH